MLSSILVGQWATRRFVDFFEYWQDYRYRNRLFADVGTDHAVDVMATNGYGKTTRSATFKVIPFLPRLRTEVLLIWACMELHQQVLLPMPPVPIARFIFCRMADRGDSNVSAWAQHYVLENQSPGSLVVF